MKTVFDVTNSSFDFSDLPKLMLVLALTAVFNWVSLSKKRQFWWTMAVATAGCCLIVGFPWFAFQRMMNRVRSGAVSVRVEEIVSISPTPGRHRCGQDVLTTGGNFRTGCDSREAKEARLESMVRPRQRVRLTTVDGVLVKVETGDE